MAGDIAAGRAWVACGRKAGYSEALAEQGIARTGVIFAGVFVAYWLTLGEPTPHFELTLQAWCLLHGRLAIDGVASAHEVVEFHGKHYLLNPPLGSLVMLPWVWIFGPTVNQTFVAALVGATGAALVSRRSRRLADALTMAILWAFGTVVWYEATTGDSWGFSIILSTIPSLLALEWLRRGRGVYFTDKVGFWGGVACLARFDLVALLPVYFWRVRDGDRTRGSVLRGWLWFGAGVLPALVFYLSWSSLRFGTFVDQAERLWWLKDEWGAARGIPMISLRSLPFNLFSALFLGPQWSAAPPWFRPTRWGQGILLTSPALLLTLRAPWDAETRFLWMGAAAALAGPLVFYNNGWVQFGCRFWIQAYPFFFGLLARQPLDDRLARTLIAASIVFCGGGLWAIRHGGFAI